MTMHLQRGLTTLNTKKRKASKRKPDSYYMDGWRKHNKFYKQKNLQTMTLDEYIDYVHGVYKPKSQPRAIQTPWHHTDSTFRRESTNVPSHNSEHSFAPATKKESMQYTGERRLVGIAMMHKSNLVPVFSTKDAKEISKMRRG